jgi:hypothetical protein
MVSRESRATTQLSIETKRQALYASLLRYAPEAGSLRDRALQRVVLSGLLNSDQDNPYRIGVIQHNLRFGPNAPEIRDQSIQQALDQLIAQEKVGHTKLKNRHAYYLKPGGNEELGKAIDSAEHLFNKVLVRLLKDTEHVVPFEIGTVICRSFMCECFARFGRQIAKTVSGRMSRDELFRTADLGEAFRAAVDGKALSPDATASLEVRCFSFLRSTEPDDEKLKFYLAQGYYFTQLLGLENEHFDPLAQQAFANSIFYLDTNVLLPRILFSDENAALFDEVIRVAKGMGIELRVTRATINEARRVAANRVIEIKKIAGVIPDELASRTHDQFLAAYLEAREINSSLTAEEFFRPFDRLTEVVEGEMGLVIDDKTEDEIIAGRDLERVAQIIQEEAVSTRKWSKSEVVLNHDVSHYALVVDERTRNPKTWFLTSDRSLIQAAFRIDDRGQPFCFSLIGLLQSISPFLTVQENEHSLVDVFSIFLTEQILPVESLFDVKELVLLAEMHEDVLATPLEQLMPALDFVKRTVLQGKPYRPAEIPRVALELRKFLTSSADEQRRALQAEAERLESERNKEEQAKHIEVEKRKAAEEESGQKGLEIESLRTQVEQAKGMEQAGSKQITSVNLKLTKQQTARRRDWMLLGFVIGIGLWFFNDSIVLKAATKWPSVQGFEGHLRATFGVLGALIFCLPALNLVAKSGWRPEYRAGLVTIIVAVGIALSSLFDDAAWSRWSAFVQIGALIATLIIFRVRSQGKAD